MSQDSMTKLVESADLSQAKVIVARTQRLIVTAALATVGYGAFLLTGKGICAGLLTSEGGFIDADRNVIVSVPQCVSLAQAPSGVIYVAIAVTTIFAIGTARRRASTVAEAMRYLDRAAVGIVILTVAALILSYAWFSLLPSTGADGGGTFLYP
ncbi:hypothetical protein ESZ53_10410 [Salinibacterium sp. UTAS2018]|uniref:hypothetical protein n=1 Tax=unclassified Salinibacterium TaxID=2632331 RepID=UPI0010094E38|nr:MULTISPECIES: hypothetical protein [unclassified Salinibacterium]MBH0007838.1 hypothetical protein [Salinibacterium sp. SWN1162]QAV70816.1 hypothetical protein ESZ53_10410 [Salinibacterium sp. UTAS2018]